MQIICFGSCPTFTSWVGSRSWLWMRNPSTVQCTCSRLLISKRGSFHILFLTPRAEDATQSHCWKPNRKVAEKLTPISFLQTFVSDKWQKIMCHCPQNEMKAFFSACMPWEWNLLFFLHGVFSMTPALNPFGNEEEWKKAEHTFHLPGTSPTSPPSRDYGMAG